MRFLVPQFIEVEDKIIGPLTLKQGIYIIGGLAITVVLWLQFGVFMAFLFGTPVLILTFALAFVEIQGRPFIFILSSAFFYILKDKLYLWKKIPSRKRFTQNKNKTSLHNTPKENTQTISMTQSKLKKLAWTLDTNNNFDKKR